MRVSIHAALVALSIAAAPACTKKDEQAAAPRPTPPSSAAAPPAPAPAPMPRPAEGAPKDTMLNDMKRCPNVVVGAESKVVVDGDSISITVAAKDPVAIQEVRARAHALLDPPKPAQGGAVEHTGRGTGGGALGKCPVMVPGLTAKVQDIAGGVRIGYAAPAGRSASDIVGEIEERIRTLPNLGAPPSAGVAPAP
jgi:hypothetical protein